MGLCTIKISADFRRVRGGRRWSGASFLIEAKLRAVDSCGVPRFGFTVTKKLGNAVVRNRIRRRIKEAIRVANPKLMHDGYDYVVIARSGAFDQPFQVLQRDVENALIGVHRPPSTPVVKRNDKHR